MGYKGQGQKQSERKGGEREGMVFKRGEGKNGESGNGFHTGTSFPSSSPAPNKTIPFIPVVCLTYVERRALQKVRVLKLYLWCRNGVLNH